MALPVVERLRAELETLGFTLTVEAEGGDGEQDDFLHLEVINVPRLDINLVLRTLTNHYFPIIDVRIDMEEDAVDIVDRYRIRCLMAID